jgi:hypothetical protein
MVVYFGAYFWINSIQLACQPVQDRDIKGNIMYDNVLDKHLSFLRYFYNDHQIVIADVLLVLYRVGFVISFNV